ncbi:MAG: SH3 domain-containing protein [Lachnospiraceae bacterium]|nr:SH3 domain-containing protein [Lachnospiraceae bacterium]
MSEMNKLNPEELENVSGGATREVDTGSSSNAAVRSGPGKSYPQVASLENGTIVRTTGCMEYEDGRNWCEISSPVYGWIASSILGYGR